MRREKKMTIKFERFRKIRFIIFAFIVTVLPDTGLAQLEVFEKNPNYLSYNGKPMLLISACPKNQWLVSKLDTSYIRDMKNFGANHTWLMLDNFNMVPWSYTKNTPSGYWDKLRALARVAYEEDVILGINLFGYGIVRYPLYFSFNKECKYCDGDTGPLTRGEGFFDIHNFEEDVVEARNVQKTIMRKIVENTWMYPNVYYSYGWELNTIWNSTVAEWVTWVRYYMEQQGAMIDPNQTHLFALEKTVSIAEAETLGVDFVVEEDGNAGKTEGIPFVYWSMEGIYRGTPVWNTDDEPKWNLEYMRSAIVDTSAAGVASIWGTDSIEMDYMHALSQFTETVENWCDEPGQEVTLTTLPPVSGGPGIDLPKGPGCKDSDAIPPTIVNLFTIADSALQIHFSEPVDPVTATDKNNYQIDPSLIIVSATISSDQKIVTLQTASHLKNVVYTLTVNNVLDEAYDPNPIAPNTQVHYMYVTELVVYNITPSFYDTAGVDIGDEYYVDRDYVVTSLPDSLQDMLWVRTANNDKENSVDNFLKFYNTTDVRLFVGYDVRIPSLPAWLQNWADTGSKIGTTDTEFRVFRKDFTSGSVELGGNSADTGSMYVVLVKEDIVLDTTPPAAPTGLIIEKMD